MFGLKIQYFYYSRRDRNKKKPYEIDRAEWHVSLSGNITMLVVVRLKLQEKQSDSLKVSTKTRQFQRFANHL